MDIKTEIRDEDNLSDDVSSQNEREFYSKIVTIRTNSDAVLHDGNDVTIKMESKSETHFTKHLEMQIKPETLEYSNYWEIDRKADTEQQTVVSNFGSQNEVEFLPEDNVIKVKYNSGDERGNKIEIIEEPWWPETIGDDIKDGDFPPLKFSRLCTEADSVDSGAKSPVLSAEVSERYIGFYNGKDCSECETQESDVTNMSTVEECDHLEQFGKCSDAGEVYSKPLYQKQKRVSNKDKKPYQCKTCLKNFTKLSSLKTHNLIHEGKKPHCCKTCGKSFTQLSHLRTHNFIHEGKKPYQCKTCDKCFTHSSALKTHNLIHEGKKPHHCKTCDKCFTHLSTLKKHTLIHEGKKPHQCKTCEKSFTDLSNLKAHSLIHEGKKPHQCKTCNKSFTQFSSLKRHNLIHEGKKPYQCKTCEKNFTDLSNLKAHNLIHEGKKLHQCKICNKRFTHLSHLKTHILIHEGTKPHHCKTCDKSFTRLSYLKRHKLVHEDKSSTS